MMLFKLSWKNLRKSMKDYAIYFITLILGVAIFYVFNAIGSQTVLFKVSESTLQIIKMMNRALSGVSVLVSLVLGFLIVYASNFLMKRRKKEFGIYLLLGMGKGKVSKIIVLETLCIGLISLVVGLGVGIVASQGMSVVVANMFEADMTKFAFTVSGEAIVKTLIYFLCIFAIVLVFDTVFVGKARLITLLTASKRQQKNMAKNPVVCLFVFIVGAVLLGTAYYYVTAGADTLTQTIDVGIQIVKGIIGTFLVFWSLSGLLLFLTTKSKKFYYKKLRCFTIKELSSRINTTVFSGSIICLMLFITICVLSSAMSIQKNINDNLKEMVPIDVQFSKSIVYGDDGENASYWSIADVFEETGVDTSMFKDVEELYMYGSKSESEEDLVLSLKDILGEDTTEQTFPSEDVAYFKNHAQEVVRLSDYNRAAKLYGNPVFTLAEDEYMIVANWGTWVDIYNRGLKEGHLIDIGGRSYHPKYKECKDGYLDMSTSHSNAGFIVLPDSADYGAFVPVRSYYLANYNVTTDKERENIETLIDSKGFEKLLNPEDEKWTWVNINSKTNTYDNSIGLTAMVVFIGVYLGIIFMISSAAILALKELSEAADNKEKYHILRRLGVEERQIHHSLFAQSALFFGLPLLVAGIHSIFGIQTCLMILDAFGKGGLLYSIITTALMLAAVYGAYFVLTYQCSKRIIRE